MFKRIWLILFFSFFILSLAFPQNTVGLISFDNESVSDGYNLVYPNNQPIVYLLNNCGEIVNTWEDNSNFRPGNSAYLLENGDLLKTKVNINTSPNRFSVPGRGEIIEVRDWDNNLKSSFELNNDQQRLHHDIEPLPNGNVLMITWELIDSIDAILAGRNPDIMPGNEIWSEGILELNPETGEIVWEWHAWDHLIQDFNLEMENFGDPSQFPGKINLNYIVSNSQDWLHFNAIDYNPVLDQIVISTPYFDEIWIIDHSTTTTEAATNSGGNSGLGGQLIYRWGNDQAYNQPGNGQQLFFQHNPNWVDQNAIEGDENFGKIILYNNLAPASTSRITIIDPVFDTNTNTYELDGNVYLPTEPSTSIELEGIASSDRVSSAQVLSNENILVMSGQSGYAFEFDQNQNIVWEYIIPISRGTHVNQGDTISRGGNFTFRLERYASDYPAFEGRDLSSKGFIENQPNEDFCESLQTTSTKEVITENLAYIDHNLITNELTVYNAAKLPYQIISVSGHVVAKGILQSNSEEIAIQNLLNGIYYLRVERQRAIAFAKF